MKRKDMKSNCSMNSSSNVGRQRPSSKLGRDRMSLIDVSMKGKRNWQNSKEESRQLQRQIDWLRIKRLQRPSIEKIWYSQNKRQNSTKKNKGPKNRDMPLKLRGLMISLGKQLRLKRKPITLGMLKNRQIISKNYKEISSCPSKMRLTTD